MKKTKEAVPLLYFVIKNMTISVLYYETYGLFLDNIIPAETKRIIFTGNGISDIEFH